MDGVPPAAAAAAAAAAAETQCKNLHAWANVAFVPGVYGGLRMLELHAIFSAFLQFGHNRQRQYLMQCILMDCRHMYLHCLAQHRIFRTL